MKILGQDFMTNTSPHIDLNYQYLKTITVIFLQKLTSSSAKHEVEGQPNLASFSKVSLPS
jgi:hypothetical protein